MNLFKRFRKTKEETPESSREFLFSEEPIPPDISELTESWELESAIPVRRLAALYTENGWVLQIGETLGVPTPQGLVEFITERVFSIADADATYLASGRLLFLKDEEFPDSVDIYLHVGTASRRGEEEYVG